jgi:predicted ABC-type transport system involved in lysophospholipase L1 biosynthesis ATPase subunit
VLNGITFDVEAGETVALVGASSTCHHHFLLTLSVSYVVLSRL